MNYYEVLVTQEYTAANSVFTYEFDGQIAPLTFAIVPIQNRAAIGIIVKKTSKPTFNTKPITTIFPYVLGTLQKHLIRFLACYYVANEAQALQLFMPSFLQKTTTVDVARTPMVDVDLPPLTNDQTAALKQLKAAAGQTVVLHGDTGSGKTRIYIDQARTTLLAGKTAVILVPEIGLIPQMQAAFTAAGLPAYVYHSALTPTQRATAWRSAYDGHPQVLIGTRSALFLPLSSVGLIVVDESHEPAYKQEEGIRYHASRVASIIAAQQGAQLILASATPLVSDIYLARQRSKAIIRMTQTAVQTGASSTVQVVDMTDKDNFSQHPMLSTALLQACEQALQRKEQILIYLNRRGTAKIVMCSTCGWQAMCPNCDIGLTYHHDTHTVLCHACGYKQPVPAQCPTCASPDILYKSAGTKALAEWLQKHFKSAKISRFDTDNTKAESLSENHTALQQGDVDIIVGTQMLVKGFDLPKLSVVGIVAADLSLNIPDFSAEERTYQLLAQAIGRVGRGHRSGNVYIQTYQPSNNVIQQAIAKNYDDFYTTQVEQKTSFSFPPVYHMATLWISKKITVKAMAEAQTMLNNLSKKYPDCILLGPVSSFRPKKRGMSTVQIVVKTTQRQTLTNIAKGLPTGWQYDLEPINLL